MTIIRAFWIAVLCLGTALLAGCYHLRLEAVPLDTPRFVVNRPAAEVYADAKYLLPREHYEVEVEDEKGRFFLTDFYHFSTRRGGLSQPEGGRLYYHRLKVTVREVAEGSEVLLESVDLEIRSSYVYDEGGKVLAFKKRYPYEHYPGMFDLSFVNRELERVKAELETSLRNGVKRGN